MTAAVQLPGDLPGLGAFLADRLREHFPRQGERERQVLALAEEAGEFVGAYRRAAGMARRTGDWDQVRDELADVAITTHVTACVLGVQIDQDPTSPGIKDRTGHDPNRCVLEVAAAAGWVGDVYLDPEARFALDAALDGVIVAAERAAHALNIDLDAAVRAKARLICSRGRRDQPARTRPTSAVAAQMHIPQMPVPMSPERRAEIRRRLPFLYPPPWQVEPWHHDDEPTVLRGWLVTARAALGAAPLLTAPDYGETVAQWATHARQDLPELLEEVDRLDAQAGRVWMAAAELHEFNSPEGEHLDGCPGCRIDAALAGGNLANTVTVVEVGPGDDGDGGHDDALPACRVCGCTEDRACAGGCHWVPDPTLTGDLCSRCAPAQDTEAIR